MYTLLFSEGRATIFMNGTHKDINLCSSMFRQESSAGIGHSYSPLALACNGMLPLFSAPSQVLQIHCLQSRLMYICSALKTRSNNSLLALVYLPLPHRRTVCLYIWQHVHTNSGPTFTLDWKLAIQFPIRTTDALFLAMLVRFCSCLCKVSTGVSNAPGIFSLIIMA